MSVKGWVYVISNKAMPGLVKVGFSLKDPALRARELANTGSPHPYQVDYEALLANPREVEHRVHRHLSALSEGREWFRCSVEQAVSAIKAVAPTRSLLETQYAAVPKGIGTEPKGAAYCRPAGTYTGTCENCGAYFSSTLHPTEREVRCPECFRLNDTNRFKRHEFTL